MKKTLLAALLTVALVAAGAAAKPGRGAGAYITIDPTRSNLAFGGFVTFRYSSNKPNYSTIQAQLHCFQGGAEVYFTWWTTYIQEGWTPAFTLSGGSWTSGAANCEGDLIYQDSNGHQHLLASTTFDVAA